MQASEFPVVFTPSSEEITAEARLTISRAGQTIDTTEWAQGDCGIASAAADGQ